MQWKSMRLVGTIVLGMGTLGAQGQTGPDSKMSMPPHDTTMPMQASNPTAIAPKSLKISFGTKTAEWTASSLAALPHTAFTVYNEHIKANQAYSGVQLIALLAPLGIAEKPHGKDFKFFVVAEGADGYKVVYSIAEVTPDVHEATVIVADTLDGKPLGASGPLQLVLTGDKRPARWVRNLANIHVEAVE